MGILREYNKYTPVCDMCLDELLTEQSFQDAVDAMKEAKWKFKKVNGEWQNTCTDCQKEQMRT
jgi:hypothetical protein